MCVTEISLWRYRLKYLINKSSVRRASFSLLSSGGLEVTLWVVDQSGGEPVDCSLQWHGAYKLRELSTNMAR